MSGPVKRSRNRPLTRPPGRPARARGLPLHARTASAAAAFIRSLPDRRWVDRLVRGRGWIPLLGVLLAGIVATQVEVLKLGASMGRWVSRTAALTSRNQALQASVAALSDDQRIERLAAQMGMVMPAPTEVKFISLGRPGAIKAAMAGLHAPDPSLFLAALSASQSAALAQAAPTVPATPATPQTTTTSQSSTAAPITTATTPASTTSTAPTSGGPAASATTQTTAPTVTSTQQTATTAGSTGGGVSPSGGVAQAGG